MLLKLMVLGVALIAVTLLSGAASAQDELPAAPSSSNNRSQRNPAAPRPNNQSAGHDQRVHLTD